MPANFDQIENCFPDGAVSLPGGLLGVNAQWLHDFANAVAAKEREIASVRLNSVLGNILDMTMDLPKNLRIIAKGFAAERVTTGQARSAVPTITAAAAELERLQRIIDSRPAINAGLPETYIEWSQGIYATDCAQAVGHNA